jgi:hypothetical protein
MSTFSDEVEIQEAAIRAAVVDLGLDKCNGALFLTVTYEDESGAGEPLEQLMKRLRDLPMIRPSSRGQTVPLVGGRLRPTMADKITGEGGWPMVAGTKKWWSDGSAAVKVGVHLGFLAGRGFTAVARKRDGRWELEDFSRFMS